jgi:RHS repeat-associated protein
MTQRYVHGPAKGVDDPLIWYDSPAAGWRRALVADQQGSIVAVADRDGNAIAINAYDEYGIPDSRNQGRFQYTGQAWIPELGMYHYKARIYSPTLGRFLQVDPIGYDDQVNLYAYVANDPVNATDPTGAITLPAARTGTRIRPQMERYAGGRGNTGLGRGRGSRQPQTPRGNQQGLIEQRINKLAEQLRVLDPTANIGLMNPPGQRTMTAVTNLEAQVENLRTTPFQTNVEARRTAQALGYTQVREMSRGQSVFTNGSNFITRDIPSRTTGTSHNGGVWKMAGSVRDLASRETRLGTYNRDLTAQIGD